VWRVGLVPAGLDEAGGAIRFRFHARDVHLVMGPPAGHPPVRFAVYLDGESPGRAHRVDVDESGTGTADYQRMYQLIRQPRRSASGWSRSSSSTPASRRSCSPSG
jgi:hypothetical protein